MPLYKCTKCHHEWEGKLKVKCDWCGANGKIIAQTTPFEDFIKSFFDSKRKLKNAAGK